MTTLITVFAVIGAAGLGAFAADLLLRLYSVPANRRATVALFIGLLAVFGWAAMLRLPPWVSVASLGLGWALTTLAVIDARVRRLPDTITLPLVGAGLLVSISIPGRPFVGHVLGAVFGYASLALLAFAYRRWRGTEAIGLGDAKLLAAAGAWLGWEGLPSVILIACGCAFLWLAVGAIGRRRISFSDEVAFGVPLCLAFWIVWLHGPLAL